MAERPSDREEEGFAGMTRLALPFLLVAGTAVVAAHYWLGLAGSLRFAIGGVVYDAVVVGAGIGCLLRSSAYGTERRAWLLLGAAILFWAGAEVYWTAYIEGNSSAPYPSPADAGYLAFYPLAYAGLVMLVRARAHELNWRLWMDGAIAALGTAALGAAFVFDFVADRTSGTLAERATSLAYPLGDIAMVAMIVGVIALTGWRPGRTWALLLAGLAAMAAADVAYTLQLTGEALPPGGWIDPIYLISAVCLGAAVWQPAEAATITSPKGGERRREIIVPAVFASVMIGLFAIQYFSATSALSTVLWGSTMSVVIVRLAMSDRENRRLLEEVRTDWLTGLANRGRVQVDLRGGCAAASLERPAWLVLFDLNGFKRYNDTLGHPAGDELLRRLGGALRKAVGDQGVAYRMGGDEFCVIFSQGPKKADALIADAVAALSAKGPGYEVGASWGAVEIPREESEPSSALRLADVRMYAQKESRRTEAAGVTESRVVS
jgi:diguanylate cyclase (GGDEF)-like protein